MASVDRLQSVEEVIEYHFIQKERLVQALKSAGAEESDYDGNRVLARLGKPLIELYASQMKSSVGESTEAIDNFASNALSIKRHEAVAKNAGIDQCITCCPRQSQPSPKTLSLAIRAIIGALWLDSGKNIDVVFQAMERLGLLVDQPICVRLSSLSHEQGPRERTSTPILPPKSPDLSAFLELDLIYDKDSPQRACSTSTVTNDHDPIMAICDSSLSRAQTETEFDPWDGERILEYDIEQTFNTSWRDSSEPLTRNHIEPDGMSLSESEGNTLRQEAGSRETRPGSSSLKRRQQSRRDRTCKRPREANGSSITLEQYISIERGKHDRLSRKFPEQIYFLPRSMETEPTFLKEDYRCIARNLFAGVGSCESIALLQEFLKHERKRLSREELDPSMRLPLQQRMDAIERLGTKIAYYKLLRRYHALSLYVEHVPPRAEKNTFIVNTDERCFSGRREKRGNPRNHAAAEVTLAMFRDMYASAPDQEAYEKKYRLFKKLRKLGQRFKLLTDTFGYGILGLLPLAPPEFPALTVTDDMLLRLPDPVFETLVGLIDRTQGGILRQFTEVVEKIVQSTFSGAFESTATFAIEDVDIKTILSLPKGSSQLLMLVSEGS